MDKEFDPEIEKEVKRQFDILKYGVSEITPEEDFKKMLRHSLTTQTPLRVKCGIDPTGTDVHVGHLVPYRKMRQFQDLGHLGVVIIGDYTASIGDPTGKNESRPALDTETIKQNAKKYMDQVYTVVDPDKTEVCFQTEWFQETSLKDILTWASQTTVAKLLGHETFRERLDQGHSLALHELFYPVLQGIDSVYVKADVELGGTDQKFNVLMGRDYQKQAEQRPQVAMLLPVITGTCGIQKMSKSLNNYIGILDEPFDKFGKVMSIPDELMADWFQYISDASEEECQEIKNGLENGSLHPNETKKRLASNIVAFFHGEEAGKAMKEQFENVFKKKEIPDEIPEFKYKRGDLLVSILFDSNLLDSKGEGRRMVKQKAVSIMDGDKIEDSEFTCSEDMAGKIIKVGKRKFLKLL
ncbi:MAG: tyrosine--tRNA ligase [Bacteriovoracaceae bacterium]|jgi:tyrosyl-tRNA synthetase|nr:tyrosine--tRNA ligase [Bacteriovoracaceae bacterium]